MARRCQLCQTGPGPLQENKRDGRVGKAALNLLSCKPHFLQPIPLGVCRCLYEFQNAKEGWSRLALEHWHKILQQMRKSRIGSSNSWPSLPSSNQRLSSRRGIKGGENGPNWSRKERLVSFICLNISLQRLETRQRGGVVPRNTSGGCSLQQFATVCGMNQVVGFPETHVLWHQCFSHQIPRPAVVWICTRALNNNTHTAKTLGELLFSSLHNSRAVHSASGKYTWKTYLPRVMEWVGHGHYVQKFWVDCFRHHHIKPISIYIYIYTYLYLYIYAGELVLVPLFGLSRVRNSTTSRVRNSTTSWGPVFALQK